MAGAVIVSRCSVGEIWSSSLSGLRSVGTNSTRVRLHASSASCAAARWPRWGGSNVPPNTPTVTLSLFPLELDVAEPDRVAGAAAGCFERLEYPHPLERPLEHLDSVRICQVGHRHDPLHSLAAHSIGVAFLLDDPALVGGRRQAVHLHRVGRAR